MRGLANSYSVLGIGALRYLLRIRQASRASPVHLNLLDAKTSHTNSCGGGSNCSCDVGTALVFAAPSRPEPDVVWMHFCRVDAPRTVGA